MLVYKSLQNYCLHSFLLLLIVSWQLTSRKPLWLDLQPADIKSRWRHNWKFSQVVNSHLVCDPTIRNRVCTALGNSGLCWTVFAWNRDTAVPAEGNGDLQLDTDLCPCGETQMISHIVESCPLTKLNGGLSRLHSVDEEADQLWFMTRIHEIVKSGISTCTVIWTSTRHWLQVCNKLTVCCKPINNDTVFRIVLHKKVF